ncbi:MAG: amidophosphoribosyltransferase, partial [Clostridiales bacterium]|nr:amidophosphoribosyltransferase [Clostridiales bacterium]
HLRVASPPFKYTCHFGTDIGDERNLIANRFTQREICEQFGADSLGHLSLEGLHYACRGCALPFCNGCFTGRYPIQTADRNLVMFSE